MGENKGRMALVVSMLKIGLIGFGGGSALIPVIQEEVVEKNRRISKKEYDKTVVVASITPGALPVEIATGVGKYHGMSEMLLAAHSMALPGSLLTVLLMTALSKFSDVFLNWVALLSLVVTPFIMTLLVHYTKSVLLAAKKESVSRMWKVVVIIVGVFLLTGGETVYKLLDIQGTPFVSLSTVAVLGVACFGIIWTQGHYGIKDVMPPAIIIAAYLICSGSSSTLLSGMVTNGIVALMIILTMWKGYLSFTNGAKNQKINWSPVIKEMFTWVAIAAVFAIPAVLLAKDAGIYILRGLASSFLSFGGGDAYLTVADGMFVSTGMISEESYYGHLVTIVNVLPGSILCKTLAGVGYLVGFGANGSILTGFVVALAGFVCSVAASGSVFSLVWFLYQCFEKIEIFQSLGRWIRPIVSGLLVNVMLSLLNNSKTTGVKSGLPFPIILLLTAALFAIFMFIRVKKEQRKQKRRKQKKANK